MNKKLIGKFLIFLSTIPLIYGIAILRHIHSGEDIDYSWITPEVPPTYFILLSLAMLTTGILFHRNPDKIEEPEEIPPPPKKRALKREEK